MIHNTEMPYLNDKLADNKDIVRREKLAAKASRTSRFLFEPQKVIDELKHSIVGQDAVISALSDVLYLLKADFADPNRPLSVNFFLGPTGVGKTETVRVLSKALLGNANAFCRIDMNTLAQEHYAAALTGAPPGYVGSKEGHTLFDVEAIEGSFSRPGIVLFDEIEKAGNEVIRSILNILDTGKLRLAGGTREINFSNSLIFMTSNVGVREHAQHVHKYTGTWRKWVSWSDADAGKGVIERELKKKFDPEFLNRIERILHFQPLDNSLLDTIIEIEVRKINQSLAAKNAHVALDRSAREQIKSYYNVEYGARNLARLLRTMIGPVVAKAMLEHTEQNRFVINYAEHGFFTANQ